VQVLGVEGHSGDRATPLGPAPRNPVGDPIDQTREHRRPLLVPELDVVDLAGSGRFSVDVLSFRMLFEAR
jgi:hypothetical protein